MIVVGDLCRIRTSEKSRLKNPSKLILFLVRAECDVAFICRTYIKHGVDPANATRKGKLETFILQLGFPCVLNLVETLEIIGRVNYFDISFVSTC